MFDWEVLLPALSALADTVEAYLLTGWDLSKVLQSIAACVTISVGGFGIYQGWRFAEKRLGDRLSEYLKREEARLADARTRLIGALRKSERTRHVVEPLFSNAALSRALKQLKWGRIKPAEEGLQAALRLIDEKVSIAEERAVCHRRQKAAAHLLLGAIADSKNDHVAAFGQFQKALEVSPDDIDALQYAGEQLLRIPDPQLALAHFEKLLDQATLRQDVLLAARSKVLQARAHYSFPRPALAPANGLLVQVAATFPSGMPQLERAAIHEFHGDVRAEAGFNVAHTSYMNALLLFSQSAAIKNGDARDAEVGARRVTSKIAKLNQSQSDGPPNLPDSLH